MTTSDLYDFIRGHKLGVLGSISEAGTPQSALVGIAVNRELEIVFDTLNTTRKYRNLSALPACSFVIGCVEEVTLQYEGEASELRDAELAEYKRVYFAAWPDGPSREFWAGMTYFVVRPKWIRYSDYRKPPPQIEEFSFVSSSSPDVRTLR